MLFRSDFPWFTQEGGVADSYDNDTDRYFIHAFYVNNRPNSSFFELLAPILSRLELKALIRAKANLYPRNELLIEQGRHYDYPFPHKGFILYINSNNGFTRLNDGKIVESIANRALFFDGSSEHNSTNCTDQQCRINISINYF